MEFIKEIQAITDAAGNVTTPASFQATMTITEVIELCFTSAGKKVTSEHIAELKSVFTATELAPLAEFFAQVRIREGKALSRTKAAEAMKNISTAAATAQDSVQKLTKVRGATAYWELRMPNGVRALDYTDYVAQTGDVPSRVLVGVIEHNGQPVRVQVWINSGLVDSYARASAPQAPKEFYAAITPRIAGQEWFDQDGNLGGVYETSAPFHIEGSSVLFMD